MSLETSDNKTQEKINLGTNISVLYYQDILPFEKRHSSDDLSLAFFELANSPRVGFRIKKRKKCSKFDDSTKSSHVSCVTLRQDVGACHLHTGGIVWETSYLLAEYLLYLDQSLGNVLEVGAGCGLVGQVLRKTGLCKMSILTETQQAMENLSQNVHDNKIRNCRALCLDWTRHKKDCKANNIKRHSFDTVVGADVIFSKELVEPLLKTLSYVSHCNSTVYLSLQVRCKDSNRLLIKKASKYNWKIFDLTTDLYSIPNCAWALEMECLLLKLTRLKKRKRETRTNSKE